jgi:acyl carrier protein
MLPTRVVHLPALPLTPTGKVDRRALPAPEQGGRAAVALPEDALQAELLVLVAPLVGVPELGVADDFFAAGGNSLQATQVLSRVRDAFGVEVGLPEFFAEPTVTRLAELVEEARADGPAPVAAPAPAAAAAPAPRDPAGRSAVPLAEPQLRLWRRHLADPANAAFHAPLALRLAGPLDPAALGRAVRALVERHPALRSRIDPAGPSQVVDPVPADPLRLLDLTGIPAADREAVARRTVRAEAERPYDLRTGPVFRPALLRLAEDDHVLLWNAHHIVTDAWSIGLQLRDLSTLYRANATVELPPLPATYADFARWQRDWLAGAGPEREWHWWRDRLAGAPSTVDLPGLPAGRLPPFRPGHVPLELVGEPAAAVLALARQAGTTPYVLLVAAFTAMLGAAAGQREVCVVTPVAGRTRTEWESVVGFFVNRVVVRVDLSGRPSVAELVDRVRRRSAEALAHQGLPFDRLARRLADELGPAAPALRLAVSVQNAPQRHDGLSGVDMGLMGDDRGEPFAPILELYSPEQRPFLLSAVLVDVPGALLGALEYDAALLGADAAGRLAERLQALLVAAAAEPDVPLEDLLGRLAQGPDSAR